MWDVDGGKEKVVCFTRRLPHAFRCALRNRNPVFAKPKFRLEVSIWKKGRVMVISNTFPIFPPPSLTTAPNHQGICTAHGADVRIPCTNSFSKGEQQRTLGEQASSRGREKTALVALGVLCVFRDQLTDRQGVDIGQLVEGRVLLARGRPREV